MYMKGLVILLTLVIWANAFPAVESGKIIVGTSDNNNQKSQQM